MMLVLPTVKSVKKLIQQAQFLTLQKSETLSAFFAQLRTILFNKFLSENTFLLTTKSARQVNNEPGQLKLLQQSWQSINTSWKRYLGKTFFGQKNIWIG